MCSYKYIVHNMHTHTLPDAYSRRMFKTCQACLSLCNRYSELSPASFLVHNCLLVNLGTEGLQARIFRSERFQFAVELHGITVMQK